MDAVTNTAGRMHLNGKATNFNLSLNSSGSCDAEKLTTQQSKINSFLGGYAHIKVTNLLEAKVVGGGVLRVYGKPIKQITQANLLGKIIIEE